MFDAYYESNTPSVVNLTEAEFNEEYVKFNCELKQFLHFNLAQLIQQASGNSSKSTPSSINYDEYYSFFIQKFLDMIKVNHKDNSHRKAYPLFYITISMLITPPSSTNEERSNDKGRVPQTESIWLLFFAFYTKNDIIQLKDKAHLIDVIEASTLAFTSVALSLKQTYPSFAQDCYTVFCDKLLKEFFNKIRLLFELTHPKQLSAPSSYHWIDFLFFFIPYYDDFLLPIIKGYFNNSILLFNGKEELFLSSFIALMKSLPFSQSASLSHFDNSIVEVLKASPSGSLLILKAMSLLGGNTSNSNQCLSLFISSLLSGIKEYLIALSKQISQIDLFILIDKTERLYFNSTIKSFFNLKTIGSDYRKVVFEVLNVEGKINETFVSAIDVCFRLKASEDTICLIMSYLPILESFEVFEWLYIHKVISRAVDDCFSLVKEKELIDRIEAIKRHDVYSYKLQTVINSIKIAKTDKMNLIVLPFHSYHLHSIGCQPILSGSLMEVFNSSVKESKFPENAKLIHQQGNVLFTSKRFNGVEFKGDVLQFDILNYIGLKTRDLKSITTTMGLSEEFALFVLAAMTKSGIVKGDKDVYAIDFNHSNEKGIKCVNMSFDYADFVESLNYSLKPSQKYIGIIFDCHIIKYLKATSSDGYSSSDDILGYVLKHIDQSTAKTLTKPLLIERLNVLTSKGFISKAKENYKYLST